MKLDHINICGPLDLLEQRRVFYCHLLDLRDGFRPRFEMRIEINLPGEPAETGPGS
ncbi:MAG: hypothetical protein HKP03_06270 [Xanthomonadales bacterium]|nr:hypothetical protein [Gammaproteobacteria bacterium]NNJ65220.1 hypothetical protein [Xanthomonadales bacterium]NNK33768.1 hypothetical protein [Xanthomonadales bacterium]NNK38067.1 hypothetical protein [Xanthomonadales bacterium]